MENKRTLRSGAVIRAITRKEADAKNLLTRQTLSELHLMPSGEPVAFELSEKGDLIYYFDPDRVVEAPVEMWYSPTSKKENYTLESGTVIERMSIKRAAACGFYPADKLKRMNYETVEEPVAFTYRADKSILFFFDKKTAKRLPLLCVRCGKDIRYKKKLCAACYEEDMKIRRAEGDKLRSACYGMKEEEVLFFDLELTGFYDHDEILSITIIDGNGDMVMDTLVKPEHTKKWNRTEKIHGITPDMVVDAPTLKELTPKIKEIFANAKNLIAYGVSTDFSHIKYIYDTPEERDELHKKVRCCANEYVRYIHEHRPELEHASLIDAMECLGIEWEGVPHSSIADTFACRKVWNVLFPNYYRETENN
ncbi:MAG: 3'-5' exonuclease [Ruminococcaceae bacterium]|nr:3'-5' exonuclease [Oscillospiraceae bacterium]